ncbi:uncharacterized protein [Palaemon carinicauda]|uniref:uncharacterized protein n=1 Tax=Palaemon carinicauda TaxID=392227 RepID=UPI0035B61A7B
MRRSQMGHWRMVSRGEDFELLEYWDLDGLIVSEPSNLNQKLGKRHMDVFHDSLADIKSQPKNLKNESSSSWNTHTILILSGMETPRSVAMSCGTPPWKHTPKMRRWIAGLWGADDCI